MILLGFFQVIEIPGVASVTTIIVFSHANRIPFIYVDKTLTCIQTHYTIIFDSINSTCGDHLTPLQDCTNQTHHQDSITFHKHTYHTFFNLHTFM
jgi:hypothetical protein